ncbi:MAG: hypothetical protein LBP78_05435 [Acidaminococcales bacterium]|jgi:hypothetical protein|nr:hypothetical protein [Acidaminococcales bacterium]
MLKKKLSISLLISLAVFCRTAAAVHPAEDIIRLYAEELSYTDQIEPYITGLLALNELEHGRNADKVRAFIEWYFSALNYPDRYNINATIYVYGIDGDVLTPSYAYDSIDGYSGLFLHLLLRYVNLTGDLAIVSDNWQKVEDTAYTIPLLQEKDGLTIALITTNQKYLMDNCEAYGGMSAYIELRKLMNLPPSLSYENIRENIKRGIMKRMYRRKDRIFIHTIENDIVQDADWNTYYPDAYAQLFPIYYELLEDDPALGRQLWRRFSEKHAANENTFPTEQRIMFQLTRNKARVKYPDLFAAPRSRLNK